MTAPLLRVKNVSFCLGGRQLFTNLSFCLAAGEHLSIIGPNGAGKSSLLRCLLGLVPMAQPARMRGLFHVVRRACGVLPQAASSGWSGTMQLRGRDSASLTPLERARIMAHVPQGVEAIPPFTVRAFVAQGRYPHADTDPRAHEAVVERSLHETGLWALQERSLGELSGGERQKAFLAAALAQEPALLVLDEPAAYLDPAHEQALHNLLLTLRHERKLAVVSVSHNLNRVLLTNGPVLTLHDGHSQLHPNGADLLTEGTLDTLFAAPFVTVLHPRTGQPLVLPDHIEHSAQSNQADQQHRQEGTS